MPDRIKIRKAPGTWVIRAGGAILGETANAIELNEAGRPSEIYFPRADVAMAFFEASATVSQCPLKGMASHFDIVTPAGTVADAALSYEAPLVGLDGIAGHLVFRLDKVTVEQMAERVL
jgi:uncharacterized protein (DUF427 family)